MHEKYYGFSLQSSLTLLTYKPQRQMLMAVVFEHTLKIAKLYCP